MNRERTSVLVASANATLQTAARRFLARYHAHVETAATGLDCVEKLRQSPPELLLVDDDLLWGGMDGVVAHIREETIPQPTVIVISEKVEGNLNLEPPIVGCSNKSRLLASMNPQRS